MGLIGRTVRHLITTGHVCIYCVCLSRISHSWINTDEQTNLAELSCLSIDRVADS